MEGISPLVDASATLDSPLRLACLAGPLLELGPDPVFDRAVQEAARRAEMPVALLSLVMSHVQFFRAQVGLAGGLAQTLVTSREDSFCQFVVISGKPFIVEDALGDARVPQSMVESHSIRAYLGVPVTIAGNVIGSLCVVDVKPRRIDEPMVRELVALARDVDLHLEQIVPPILRPLPRAERLGTLDDVVHLRDRAEILLAALAPVAAQLPQGSATPYLQSWIDSVVTGDSAVHELVALHGQITRFCQELAARASTLPTALDSDGALREQASTTVRLLAEAGAVIRLLNAGSSGVIDGAEVERVINAMLECRQLVFALQRAAQALLQSARGVLAKHGKVA
ncbi:MAG TPA: GAF domain-containing protein [Polyangiaceae bacterium]|nr:GAF domain-containing protein [Polyangiaceae bacterium]